jgi:hypothetical protein
MKFFKQSNRYQVLTLTLVLVAVFALGREAHAMDVIDTIVSGIMSVVVGFLGWVVTLLISSIIYIAQYNNFIESPVVIKGWVIVRDICNMFFILMLLVIAFGTILRIDNYAIKKSLPKLIMAAILINFSKTICGIAIDAAGVVMLTFVNGFKDFGGAQLTQILGVDRMLSLARSAKNATGSEQSLGISPSNSGTPILDSWSLVLTYLFAFAYLLIAIVVLFAMLSVLVTRMIMLWIYIIISPVIFISSKAAGSWKSSFIKYLVTGPVLAFFIWLSLSTLQSVTSNDPNNVSIGLLAGAVQQPISGVTDISSTEFFIGYIVSIGLLVGGLIVAQQVGGAAGAAAGSALATIKKGSNWAKKTAMRPVKYAQKKAWDGTKAVGGVAVGTAKGLDERYAGGRISKTAGWIKENASTDGLRKAKDAMTYLTSQSGFKFNDKANEIRHSVTAHGAWKDKDTKITYKANDEGIITAEGKSTTGLSQDEKNKLLPKIRAAGKDRFAELGPMSEGASKFYRGYNASTMVAESRGKKIKADAAEVNKAKEKYKDAKLNDNELFDALESATSVTDRKAAFEMLAENGLTPAVFNPNKSAFDAERKAVKDDPREVAIVKAATAAREAALAIGDEAEIARQDARLEASDKRKDIKFSDISKRENAEKRESMEKYMSMFTYNPEIKKDLYDKMIKFNPNVVFDMDNAVHVKTLDGLLASGKVKVDEVKLKNFDAYFLAQLMERSKEVLGVERHNAIINKADKGDESSKEKSAKLAEASMINARKYDQEVSVAHQKAVDANTAALDAASRGDAVGEALARENEKKAKSDEKKSAVNEYNSRKDFLKLDGNIAKAFAGNKEHLTKFFREASAPDLSNVDPGSMDAQSLEVAANNIVFSKVQQLNRKGDSQDLVHILASELARINSPEAIMVPSIDSSITVDIDACNYNSAIQNALKKAGATANQFTNISKINNFRTTTPSAAPDTSYKKDKNKKWVVADPVLDSAIATGITSGLFG